MSDEAQASQNRAEDACSPVSPAKHKAAMTEKTQRQWGQYVATNPILQPPPGIVGDLRNYFLESARYPIDEGAIFAALGLVAGIAGRCFNVDGTGLNLYMLLLAESGRGKEEMDSGIERILSAIRPEVPMVDEFMGPNTFASGQALARCLENSPSILSIQSEFGLRLKELNDPRAPMSTVVLRRVLLELYAKSGQQKLLRPTVYSDREKNTKVIHAPCLTILGESTPGHVFNNLSFSDIEDGLLPRCLLLECTTPRPKANANAGAMPPYDLVRRLVELTAACLTKRNSSSFFRAVPSPGAMVVLQELQDYLDHMFNDKTVDPHERSLWNRAGVNVKRVSALVAVGCAPDFSGPIVIEAEHVDWAADFVETCVKQLATRFRAGIVGVGEERRESEIKKYVSEYIHMAPTKRISSYKVPAKLAVASGLIGYDYLRRRANRCVAFTQSGDFNRVLAATLAAMCQSGALMKLSPVEVSQLFGLKCDVYGAGDPAQYR